MRKSFPSEAMPGRRDLQSACRRRGARVVVGTSRRCIVYGPLHADDVVEMSECLSDHCSYTSVFLGKEKT